MVDKVLTVLGVHGLGDHRGSDWQSVWTKAVTDAFPKVDGVRLDFKFVTYDDIFADTKLTLAQCVKAFYKLATSGVMESLRRERGLFSQLSTRVQWTAGYVVAWVENEPFRTKSRKRILDAIAQHSPDIVLAHSLGSLITYNAFTHVDATKGDLPGKLAKMHYVTFGSQIGNPFVIKNLTRGRVQALDVKFWHHLYNIHDDVLTAEIRLPDAGNFDQTDTPFDNDGFGDHAAESYLGHAQTIENVWQPIAAQSVKAKTFAMEGKPRSLSRGRAKAQKALLVGINEYPNPAQRLEGCVNDVFTMSAVLQQCGIPADAIRVCLDERATKEGILSRLKWLLDDPQPGDELIFYYSGHGARVPEYGENFEPDHFVETLVPYDFDWTPEHFISDDQIYSLYSQLPYDCRLILIFDCCHSGGIHREGGSRPRGITPPDDVRHRELKWDKKTGMWVSRDFARINKDFTRDKSVAVDFFGREGATRRLGRAGMLRAMSAAEHSKLKKEEGKKALEPYLPMIIEACGEEESSYEYRHGATSHGAFTFCLANILREQKALTFEALITKVREQLADLRYNQVPQILGPKVILQAEIPWTTA